MSRQNLEDNLTRRQRHNSPRFGSLRMVLGSDITLTTDGPPFCTFNPGVVDRLVVLPALLPNGGQWYLIGNNGTAGRLNVVDSLGVSVTQLSPGQVGMIYSAPGLWIALVMSAISNTIVTTVVAAGASYNAAITDDVILVKKTVGSATTINLPAASLKSGYYTVKDGKGDANANPITIAPSGLDTIDVGSVVINSPFGAAQILSVPGQGFFLTNFG